MAGTRWLRPVAGLLLSAVFLYLSASRVDGQAVGAVVRGISPLLPALALIVVLGELGVRAWRWHRLLEPVAEVPVATAYEYLAIGHFANTLLPARLGDGARAYLAGGAFGVSRLAVLGTILVERLSDGLFILAVVTLAVLLGAPELAPLALGAAALAGVGALVLAAVFFAFTRSRARTWRLGAWLHEATARITVGARGVRSAARAFRVLGATAVSFVMAVVVFDLTARAVGLTLQPWQSATIIGGASLSTAIPAGPGSLGTYEFVGVTVMTSMGIAPEQAFVVIALVHVLVTLPPALIGLGAAWRRHLALRSIAELDSGSA
jgi:glycosyltransferase 2 family protein